MIVAGIDEAGYGPLLGPLVMGCSVFRLPDSLVGADLWEAFAPAVRRTPGDRAVPVADSKRLFQRRKGLVHLEEGIFPFFLLRHERLPGGLRGLLAAVGRRGRGAADAYLDGYPWYRGRDVPLPRETFPAVVRRLRDRLAERLEELGVEFVGMAAVPVEVGEFNDRLRARDNKARVSFEAAGALLRRLWRRFADEPVRCVIDRQGGRTHYSQQLFEALRPRGVRIEAQGPDRCDYVLARGRETGAGFHVHLAPESEERHLPVALASMLAKYIRELHMVLFNEFWAELQSGLRPTAGYTADARRFLADTEATRRRLAVDEGLLIRRR